VLSGAPENALAQSESTLRSSRGAWEHLEVLRSTGEGNWSVWEVWVWLPDWLTFCWCTQWTDSYVSSQLAAMPHCSSTIGYWQSEKKWRKCDQRALCTETHGIGAGCGVICRRGICDGSDGARPLERSHSARMEMSFPDAVEGGSLSELSKGASQCWKSPFYWSDRWYQSRKQVRNCDEYIVWFMNCSI